MKLVFSPGYRINVEGKVVHIAGFDECPKQDPVMTKFFGQARDEGSFSCVVINNERSSVKFALALPSGAVTETWQVIRKSGKTNNVT